MHAKLNVVEKVLEIRREVVEAFPEIVAMLLV